MNPVNHKKLLHSKWTATQPVSRSKHFMVVEVIEDDDEVPQYCLLEAVVTGKQFMVHWRDLKNSEHWRTGWL
jgi:tryptophan-rich hypothetical protein